MMCKMLLKASFIIMERKQCVAQRTIGVPST